MEHEERQVGGCDGTGIVDDVPRFSSPLSAFNFQLSAFPLWSLPLAILASLALYAIALWFGELNQDEGWYLYAGRLVSEGQHPFIDFASTQGPVMAYVYALSQPLVTLWGVAGGRLFTAILGFATALCAARLAYRVAGYRLQVAGDGALPPLRPTPYALSSAPPASSSSLPLTPHLAAFIAFSLLGLNLYHVYFTTMVKTYSLAGLLVVLGFLALEKALRGRRSATQSPSATLHVARSTSYGALAAALFALAAGTRLSAGILLPAIWLTLLWQWWSGGRRRESLFPLAGFLLGGTVVLLAIYLPFIIAAPEALTFGLLEYHSARAVGSLPVVLLYKAGFLIRLVGAYFPCVVLAAFCLGCWAFGTKKRRNSPTASSAAPETCNASLPRPTFHLLLLTSLLAVTALHLAAIFPYDDYQVFIMPLLAVLLSCKLTNLISRLTSHVPCSTSHSPLSPTPDFNVAASLPPRILPTAHKVAALLSAFSFTLLAHSASSPLLQNWLLASRDRIWWPLRAETSLQRLQSTAETVRALASSTPLSPTPYALSSSAPPLSPTPYALSSSAPPPSKPYALRSKLFSPPPSKPYALRPKLFSPPPLSPTPYALSCLLTQDTYLAVESGLRVPPGMELGPFCYFPQMPSEKAAACHVLNRDMLRALLASCDAPVAAFSGYGFAIQSPEITELPVDEQAELWRILSSRYEQETDIEAFGQADTRLQILIRRK